MGRRNRRMSRKHEDLPGLRLAEVCVRGRDSQHFFGWATLTGSTKLPLLSRFFPKIRTALVGLDTNLY